MKTRFMITLVLLLVGFSCCIAIEPKKSSENDSMELAEKFIGDSATYSFDGYGLEYTKTLYPDIAGCVSCYQFIYTFNSSHAGYGDRSGEVLAQAITEHKAVVTVTDGEIVSAVLDERWDMIDEKEIKPIGGEKDEHSCLIAAGYSWCASEKRCMRKWEENCTGDRKIESFDDCVQAGYPVMESYPRQCEVSGTAKRFTENIGLANPAAAYCQEKGYGYRIVSDEYGERGECYVDEKWVDEWRFYRSETEEFEYDVVERTEVECSHDYDCETPMDYLVRSDCPYTSKCLDGFCAVVCPTPETGGEYAVNIASEYVRNLSEYREEHGRNLRVTEVIQARCPGCWVIDIAFYADSAKVENGTDKVTAKITLGRWNVTDAVVSRKTLEVLSPEKCLALGGRSVNIVGGATCDEDETCAGDVIGFISPNICCVPKLDERTCASARGHWNDCSNRCVLDNQGQEDVACTTQCEALCECSGIAGFSCPEGYYCKTPSGVVDALGYCVEGEGFCGSSTYGKCISDSDCVTGGCSGQVCQSGNESPVISTCEYRECYDPTKYLLSCACVDNQCVWA